MLRSAYTPPSRIALWANKTFENSTSHRFLWIAILVLCLSCRNESATTVQPSSVPPQTAKKDARPAVIRLESIGLASVSDVGTSQQAWNTEQIHDRLKKELVRLGRLIERSDEPSESDFAELVDANFVGRFPSFKTMQTVFEDEFVIVKRTTGDPASSFDNSLRDGSSSFLEIAGRLRKPFGNATNVRTHFKTFHIQVQNQSAELWSYFESTGKAKSGVIQQRAVWKTRWNNVKTTPVLTSVKIEDLEEARGKENGTLLSDVSNAVLGANDSFSHQMLPSTDYWLDRLEFRYGIDPGAWLGLSIADVNGDGLDDIFACQPGGLPNRLYLQTTHGTAIDVSQAWGVDWLDHTHAALFVDWDNDQDQDLVLSLKPGIALLENVDNDHFEIRQVKPIPKSNPYALSAADIDNDGFLDIYVCCYSMRRGEMERHFIQRPVPYHDANNGGRNVLLKNDGNWMLTDITNQIGLDVNNRRFSFASCWEDYDNDGDLDLYVANDYGRNNLYRNDNGRFRDVAANAGVEDISAGMSASWSDYDNDGWMDLYVSNMFSSAGNRIAFQRRFRESDSEQTRISFQRHARGNSLFHNSQDGSFSDVSVEAGVTMGRWAWGSSFADINNDGLDDILVANGFITQEDTGDL